MTIEEVQDWLKRNERSATWLARHAGLDRGYVWRVVHGERPFEGEARRKISEAIARWNC